MMFLRVIFIFHSFVIFLNGGYFFNFFRCFSCSNNASFSPDGMFCPKKFEQVLGRWSWSLKFPIIVVTDCDLEVGVITTSLKKVQIITYILNF